MFAKEAKHISKERGDLHPLSPCFFDRWEEVG